MPLSFVSSVNLSLDMPRYVNVRAILSPDWSSFKPLDREVSWSDKRRAICGGELGWYEETPMERGRRLLRVIRDYIIS